MKNSKSNLQDLLKTLSIIAMITDHLLLFLFQDFCHLRIFRIEVAFFAFFAGYNSHKSGLHKFVSHVLPFAIITQFSPIFWYDMLNILFAFIISRILLSIYFKYENRYVSRCVSQKYFSFFVVLFFCIISVVLEAKIEYEFFAFVFMLIGALKFRKENVFLHLLAAVVFFNIFTYAHFENTLGIYIYPSIVLNISVMILNYVDLDKKIHVNTNFISRNIIYIYSFHLLLLSLINYIIRLNYYARIN